MYELNKSEVEDLLDKLNNNFQVDAGILGRLSSPKEIPFDAILIKKLKSSNTLGQGSTSNQTHIAITGREMDIFPYPENYYLLAPLAQLNSNMKRFYVFQIPVELSENNLDYLSNSVSQNNAVDSIIASYTTTARSVRASSSTKQTEVSYKNLDDPQFISFRKTLDTGDYLLFLKKKRKVDYLALGIKSVDAGKIFPRDASGNLSDAYIYFDVKSITPYSPKLFTSTTVSQPPQGNPDLPRNTIIYGAPGTGKSHLINEKLGKFFPDPSLYTRVVFHNRYSNAEFVGTYKPQPLYRDTTEPIYDSDMITPVSKGKIPMIDYRFSSGPFLRILSEAISADMRGLNNKYLLVIEEINRADAPAVFGEIFQLLDRDMNGESRYEVDLSTSAMDYLRNKCGPNLDKAYIPSNLYIWATMNSADQGVMPLDTAFKRRWSFRYLPLNKYQDVVKDVKIKLNFLTTEIPWNAFREVINEKLKMAKISEDRLIGPFFLSDDELKDPEDIKNKLLLYLVEDVLRHNKGVLFNETTFTDIVDKYDKNQNIFNISEQDFLNA